MFTTTSGSLSSIIASAINFINGVLVPFVFALAFAAFLFGMLRFFFLSGGDATKRKEGRGFIFGSVIALAVMISVWGLVNLLSGTFQLNYNQPPLPTFNPSGTGASIPGGPSPIPGSSSPTPDPSSAQPSPIPGSAQTQNCANGNCADVQGLF